MYDESVYFDNSNQVPVLDGIPQSATSINSSSNNNIMEESLRMSSFSIEELASHQNNNPSSVGLVDHNLQHHLGGFDLDQELHSHLMQQDAPPQMDHSNWNQTMQGTNQQFHYTSAIADEQQQNLQCYDTTIPYTGPSSYTVTANAPDLLNLLHMPRCTVAPPVLPPAPTISFSSPNRRTTTTNFPVDIFGAGGGELPAADNGPMLYDPAIHLGYPSQQSHLLRDLFHSLPQNYGLFCGVDEREGEVIGGGGCVFQEEDGRLQFDNPVFDYRRDVKVNEKRIFPTEKHRRQQMNSKFDELKSFIPNPSKSDRASIVMDAIDYIQELKRTVSELKILIEKKKFGTCRSKWPKTEDVDATAGADMESSSMRPLGDDSTEHLFNGPLRSSWLQRRSRETFVDVRIVDDEVNIKITLKKKANCLLLASKALDDLQLDIVHISGGFIGEHYIFMFNTKIFEGSTVYASAVATKLLEAMDRPSPPPYPPPGF